MMLRFYLIGLIVLGCLPACKDETLAFVQQADFPPLSNNPQPVAAEPEVKLEADKKGLDLRWLWSLIVIPAGAAFIYANNKHQKTVKIDEPIQEDEKNIIVNPVEVKIEAPKMDEPIQEDEENIIINLLEVDNLTEKDEIIEEDELIKEDEQVIIDPALQKEYDEIVKAFSLGDITQEQQDRLKELLASPLINPNLPDENEETPFHLACRNASWEIIKLFLGAPGVNLNAQGHDKNTGLMFLLTRATAIKYQQKEMKNWSLKTYLAYLQREKDLQNEKKKNKDIQAKNKPELDWGEEVEKDAAMFDWDEQIANVSKMIEVKIIFSDIVNREGVNLELQNSNHHNVLYEACNQKKPWEIIKIFLKAKPWKLDLKTSRSNSIRSCLQKNYPGREKDLADIEKEW